MLPHSSPSYYSGGGHHCYPILRGCATLGYCSAHHRLLWAHQL